MKRKLKRFLANAKLKSNNKKIANKKCRHYMSSCFFVVCATILYKNPFITWYTYIYIYLFSFSLILSHIAECFCIHQIIVRSIFRSYYSIEDSINNIKINIQKTRENRILAKAVENINIYYHIHMLTRNEKKINWTWFVLVEALCHQEYPMTLLVSIRIFGISYRNIITDNILYWPNIQPAGLMNRQGDTQIRYIQRIQFSVSISKDWKLYQILLSCATFLLSSQKYFR